MKKILLFLLLSIPCFSQTALTLDRINAIWNTTGVPIGTNKTNTFYTLYPKLASGSGINISGSAPSFTVTNTGTISIYGTNGTTVTHTANSYSITSLIVSTGTFMPVGSITSNLTGLTFFSGLYSRTGDIVNVSGVLEFTVTNSAAGSTSFLMTVPINSNMSIGSLQSGSGGAFVANSTTPGSGQETAAISGNGSPNIVALVYYSSDNNTHRLFYNYSYIIN